jgi:serine/threonine protein kinase
VIDVYDADEEDGRLYLTMRYVDGMDLEALLLNEGRLPPLRAANIVAKAAEGLDAAHSCGLVHRDVKPHNILVTRRTGHEHVYLTDFGLTKRVGGTSLLATKGMVGTPPTRPGSPHSCQAP